MRNPYASRLRLMDYIAPRTRLFRCRHALLFGSRHAQAPLVARVAFLHRMGYFETLIVSGGSTQGREPSEAEELAARLVEAGLDHRALILETASGNTKENIQLSREKMHGVGVDRLLLIGKIYAKRRYVMTLRRHWPEIKTVACDAMNYFGVSRDAWWTNQELRARILSERRKIATYLGRADIQEVDVVDERFVLDAAGSPPGSKILDRTP